MWIILIVNINMGLAMHQSTREPTLQVVMLLFAQQRVSEALTQFRTHLGALSMSGSLCPCKCVSPHRPKRTQACSSGRRSRRRRRLWRPTAPGSRSSTWSWATCCGSAARPACLGSRCFHHPNICLMCWVFFPEFCPDRMRTNLIVS